jgi:hypothetical protein
MRLDRYLAVAGALALLFGLAFLLAPAQSLALYAMPTEAHNLLQSRYFGSALAALGVVGWLGRHTEDRVAGNAMVGGFVIGSLVGAGISTWAALTGLQGPMVWSGVAVYALLALGGAATLMGASGKR